MRSTLAVGDASATRLPLAHAAIFALWSISLVAYLNGLTNPDVAWFLVSTAKWLGGARLYHDIIENNPPLIFFLHIAPVFASRVTGFSAEALFVIYIHVMIALSLWLSARVLSAADEGIRVYRHLILLVLLIALCSFSIADLGEREHMMVTLALPYILSIVVRASGGTMSAPVALSVGALAAIGLGLKPHFLLTPIALEIYLICHLRSPRTLLRIEALTLAAGLAVYGLGVVLFAPEYLSRIVPWALLTYSAYNHPMLLVLFKWQTMIVPLLTILHVKSRRTQARPEIADVFLIAAVVFYVVYLLQHAAFNYRIIPSENFSFLALFAIAVLGPLMGGKGRARVAIGGFAVAAMLAIPIHRGPFKLDIARDLEAVLTQYGPVSSVSVFSSYLWVGFPLVNLVDAQWASRFPCLWLLPGSLNGKHSPQAAADPALREEFAAIERYTIDAVVQDMTSDPPRFVIVDRRPDPRFVQGTLDYVTYFSQDARFRRLWSNYRKIDEVTNGTIGPYDIYLRVDSEQPAPPPHP